MTTDAITRLNEALEGRYLIELELDESGMATVSLADDLKPDGAGDRNGRRRRRGPRD